MSSHVTPAPRLAQSSLRMMCAVVALAAASLAQAQGAKHRCPWAWPGEAWRAPDKRLHFAGGFGLALSAGLVTRNAWDGLAAGVAVGAAWEIASWTTGRGYCSGMDFAATALGAVLGASGSRLVLYLNERGTPMVGYSWAIR